MNPDDLRRLLIAPEIIVVDLVEAALDALRRAILVEHPTLGDYPAADHSSVPRRALAVLRSAARLHCNLRAYRRAVDHVLNERPRDDLPF